MLILALALLSPALAQDEVPAAASQKAASKAPSGMVWVEPGEFTMGWDGEDGRPDERPADDERVVVQYKPRR